MSEHIIHLPESLYRCFLAAAEAKGLTPTSWIVSQIPIPTESNLNGALNTTAVDNQSRPLLELLADAGLADETIHSQSRVPVKKDDAFGDALIADMARQGIYIP